jgi:ABC-2 type transport system ATP-binding protein
MELFVAQNIVKQYYKYTALDNVSISVKEGSIFGLLGPNGAGKTTLIRIINQITAPDSGQLFFKGRKFEPDDIYKIGYLPEERGLYRKMKVGEQVIYLAQLKGLSKHDAVKRLKYWFEKFEIFGWWDKKVEELSKGMQQKIQFITTIIHEPELIIFDEPFSGFDPINVDLLKNEILNLKQKGSTIIFSTHNMDSVEELCSHITLINKSKNILSGEINEIRNHFKTGIYRITFSGDENVFNSKFKDIFEIIDMDIKNFNHKTIKMHVKTQLNNNQILSLLLPEVSIISFEEVVPSMTDVFIKVVKN